MIILKLFNYFGLGFFSTFVYMSNLHHDSLHHAWPSPGFSQVINRWIIVLHGRECSGHQVWWMVNDGMERLHKVLLLSLILSKQPSDQQCCREGKSSPQSECPPILQYKCTSHRQPGMSLTNRLKFEAGCIPHGLKANHIGFSKTKLWMIRSSRSISQPLAGSVKFLFSNSRSLGVYLNTRR